MRTGNAGYNYFVAVQQESGEWHLKNQALHPKQAHTEAKAYCDETKLESAVLNLCKTFKAEVKEENFEG